MTGSRHKARSQPPPDDGRRIVELTVVRLGTLLGLLATAAMTGGTGRSAQANTLPLAACYLAATGVLSATALMVRRLPAVVPLTAAYLLDVVVLAYLAAVDGDSARAALAVTAYLVAVTLLVSYRTGLLVAFGWTVATMLLQGAATTGLTHTVPERSWTHLATVQGLVWFTVLVACTASAVGERELYLRTWDGESLTHFAASLRHARTSVEVCEGLVSFLTGELGAVRAGVVRRARGRLTLLAGSGVATAPAVGPGTSALLETLLVALRGGRQGPLLARSLDPARDPWLCALLPSARRVVALTVSGPEQESPEGDVVAVVVQQGGRSGYRVDQRFVAAVEQAVAASALALDRAEGVEREESARGLAAASGVPRQTAVLPTAGEATPWVDEVLP